MQVSKQSIVDMLRNDGNEGTAVRFENEAPDTIDTERDKDLLHRLGVDLEAISGDASGLGGTNPNTTSTD